VALPNPLPDNPLRWDGWKNYNSDNLYARLCLTYESNPNAEQIEDNCRQLLVWWQKKLPLKNQPSNPISQMLRGGMDEAPALLAEARTKLLDAEARAVFDQQLHEKIVAEALGEFKKLLSFAMGDNRLREEDEQRLYERGRGLGLSRDDMQKAIDAELERLGARRVAATPAAPAVAAPAPVPQAPMMALPEGSDPFNEFRRMLRLSKLALDGDDMTDDQRDAMCNMGESLGLTGGQAEDLIDEYLEEAASMPMGAPSPVAVARAPVRPAAPAAPKPAVAPVAPAPAKKPEPVAAAPAPAVRKNQVVVSPLARAQERQKFPNFTNTAEMEMLLIPSGNFLMGSTEPDAAQHEQPVTPITLSCFFMSRHPVTNAQFEKFDPNHKMKRAPWADDKHPVVYVNSKEAEKFCQWLSTKEGKKYRLPTEAEWEYAARGSDNLIFPWGGRLDAGHYANFADKRTTFAWRDPLIDDGFAETSPVGSYPRGASPFGIEDLAGNVFEWCADYFEAYKGKDRTNPRGPSGGMKRMYRGGSWKSRPGNLRTSARNFNLPDYSSNDVGFRIICECTE
jgi:formylglycine-generating enzyme required for sulfatase activity